MDVPSHFYQFALLPPVSLDVPPELLAPVVDVGLREVQVALWTPVPEAPVHEYRELPSRVGDIRPAYVLPVSVIYSPVESVSWVASLPEPLPDSQFWFRVLTRIRDHDIMYRRGGSRGGLDGHRTFFTPNLIIILNVGSDDGAAIRPPQPLVDEVLHRLLDIQGLLWGRDPRGDVLRRQGDSSPLVGLLGFLDGLLEGAVQVDQEP